MKTYTLTVTEKQAQAISHACEIMARLGIGQLRSALDELPLQQWPFDAEAHDAIRAIVSQHTIDNVDGWRSSLGITNTKTRDRARVAWDLHCVIRHRLSWDEAVARGDVAGPDSVRNWNKMLGVNYDEPMTVGSEPLATIKQTPAVPA